MFGDWKSDRLAGVLSHVPVEFHETRYMQERGEFHRVANKLADLSEEGAGASWLSTKIEKPVNKRAVTVVM